MLRGTLADTCCIEPVCFGQVTLHAVVFGQSATASLQGQPGRFESFIELPAGRIDGSSSCKRRFRLGQDAGQHRWLLVQEVLDEVRALLDVTRPAGQGEVAHAMRAASGAAEDVLNLQGNIFGATIGALPPPLLRSRHGPGPARSSSPPDQV